MRYYLQRPDGSISDSGDYPESPAEREDGEWQPGEPPIDSQTMQSWNERLRKAFEDDLPEEMQADLAPLKAAVKVELEQERYRIVRLIIQRAQIPPELEMVRDTLLNILPNP